MGKLGLSCHPNIFKMQPTILLLAGLTALAQAAPGHFDAWESFKVKFGKVYENPEDEAWRRDIFQMNLEEIIKHNELFAAKLTSYSMGINSFSDMLPHEFIAPQLPASDNLDEMKTYEPPVSSIKVPESVDWRKVEGVVSNVKNQGSCGSCWSFSATGALEGAWKLNKNQTVVLSEKQLMDCSTANYGCRGGWKEKAWLYIKAAGGIESEEDYPYRAVQGSCKFVKSKAVATVTDYQRIKMDDEQELKEAVANEGPVGVSIYASSKLQRYRSGVFVDNCPKHAHNHAVLVVGYGHDAESNLDFWIVKNSWGRSFGEDGYVRMARNRDSMCSIAMSAMFPTVL